MSDIVNEITAGEHSWKPSSLVAHAANPPEPPTIGGLLYPAKRTLLSGETESLKTWLGLILAKAEMDVELPVAWVDLDAMGPGELLSRLQALGVPDQVTDEFFLYYEPSERLVRLHEQGRTYEDEIEDLLAEVCNEVATRGVRLFVIDAFNPMLSLHGLDPGSTPDIETFWREVATPLTTAGAAPTLLDHVTKNAETRGKYAYGSERKASGAIVHIGFRILEPFTRGGTGRALLATHKDRPGYLPRPSIGRLVLVSDGAAVTYTLEEDRSHAGDTFRPTVLMERVSIRLEGQVEPRSQRWVEENVTGKGPAVWQALSVLVDEGFVAKDETPRGHFFVSVRPYREAQDQAEEEAGETASPPRPHRVPDLRSIRTGDRVPASPPYRDADAVAVDRRTNRVPDRVPALRAMECEKHPHARRWRSKLGTVRCVECLPPVTEGAVVEWLEAVA